MQYEHSMHLEALITPTWNLVMSASRSCQPRRSQKAATMVAKREARSWGANAQGRMLGRLGRAVARCERGQN